MNIHIIALKTLSIMTVLTISGCGGGSEGEKESPPTETVETIPAPIILAKEVRSTNELISTPDFNFISNTDVNVTLPVSPSTSIGYFINICTNFSKENNEVKINYDSCKLRSPLSPREQSFTITLSPAELVLVAQVWPIEEGAQPITIYWNITESGGSWKVAI